MSSTKNLDNPWSMDEAGVVETGLVCHLLDAEGRALCFARIAARRVHDAVAPGGYVTFAREPETTCEGCGRPRCPVCAVIDRSLGRLAA